MFLTPCSEIAQANHQLVIIAPLDGGPAKAAGIVAGDVIRAINGVPVRPETLNAATNKLRGPIGTSITLSIMHPHATKPVTISLVRQRIKISSVATRLLEPGFAYIRISEFQEDTARELTSKLAKLEKDHARELGSGLVLPHGAGVSGSCGQVLFCHISLRAIRLTVA